MKLQKLHITLLCLLIWSFSFCQQHTNYSLNDGLPSNHVYRITQDYDGFIWIITDKGMSKFDGKTFKNFTIKEGLPSNDIWNIRVTPDNKVWFFTNANKLGYILDDTVYSFPSDQNKMLRPQYINQSGNEIAFNDGRYSFILKDSLWQATKNKPYEGDRNKRPVLHPSIRSVALNTLNSYYELETRNGKNRLQLEKNPNMVWGNINQINDSLFVAKTENQYAIINLNTEKIKISSNASPYINNSLDYFRAHNVNNEVQFTDLHYVGYMGDDYQINDIQSIPSRFDSHFSFIDETGNTWSATFNKGVYMLPKSKSRVRYLAENKKIQELKLVDTTLYAAIFKEGYFEVLDHLKAVVKNNQFQYGVSNIPELERIYFSSERELIEYEKNQFDEKKILDDYNKNLTKQIVLWQRYLYSYNVLGVVKIAPENFTLEKEYKFSGVTSISKTKEKLLVGSQQGLFELKNGSVVKLITNTLFDLPVISQVSYDNNTVVIGTDGNGAYVTDGYNAQPVFGANELSVQDVFVEKNSNFWLATNKGVHHVVKKDTSYTIARSYYEADGLLLNNTNSVAVKNDSLFVATDIGVSVMSLQEVPNNQLQELYLKQVLVNGKQELNEQFSTQYTNNNLVSFSVGVIDYSDQHNLTYSYKLLPLNNEWVTTTSQEINFTNLEPREYQLDLRATNHQGESALKTVYFTITPLWYQTFWFRLGVTLLSLLLIYVLFKWSKNRVKKKVRAQEKAKQKAVFHELHALRSQMNPHFVFNSLNAIQYYMNNNELELSEKYLVKFSRLIRMFFDFSREQFITIDQEVRLLNGYLEIEKMRFGDDFKFEVKVDSLIEKDVRIPSMLLQPIVENAVNHGLFHQEGNGVISVTFQKQKEGQDFTVCIKDNGVGFAKAKEIKLKSIITHTSKSAEILLDRLDLINSSTEWDITQVITDLTTETSSGTSVLLTFNKKKYD